jgi:hypothetical protein
MPRVLITVPLVLLVLQKVDEAVDLFVRLFTSRTENTAVDENRKRVALKHAFPNIDFLDVYSQRAYISLVKQIRSTIVGGSASGINTINQNTIVDVAVIENASRFINKNYTMVVMDEIQEILKSESDASFLQKVDWYHNVFKQIGSIQTILLTGSLHQTTVSDFKSFLESEYGFKTFVSLPSKSSPQPSKNRSDIKIVHTTEVGYGTNDPRDVNKIIKHIKSKIEARSRYNLLVLFSKEMILKICLGLFDIISPLTTYPVHSSKISTKEPEARWKQGLGRLNNSVLLSGNYPREYVDQVVNAYNTNRIKVGANMFVSNPILAECISRGFGFIVGARKDSPRSVDKLLYLTFDEKRLVQDLFVSGRLNYIISTSAVGVGVNLVVQHLYLPSLMMYSDEVKKPVPIQSSDLLQLLHRAGRGSVPTAFIYTTPDNAERLTELMTSSDVSSQMPVIDVSKLKNIKPQRKLYNFFKSFGS